MVQRLINKDKIQSSIVKATGSLLRTSKSPDEALGDLFTDVQKQKIFSDGKTFADLVPMRNSKQMRQEYTLAKNDPDFDLREFVTRHFYDIEGKNAPKSFVTNPNLTVEEHIDDLWGHLTRRNRMDRGSLIALPYSYIVPGGRFSEQFYWDSYFIMLGLATKGKWRDIEGLIKNFAYLLNRFGFIPTANRTYLLSRSQPPFFSDMLRLLADHSGKHILIEYLPHMIKEYNFWMKGSRRLQKQEYYAFARLVQVDDGSLMNRYYDNKITPRPESLDEDTETAGHTTVEQEAERLYLHLRAGAESGWDFSSRWFSDPNDIRTIHTADIIPVDLNALLYNLEITIAESYSIIKQSLLAGKFKKLAMRRKMAINKYCWDDAQGFFVDYDFHKHQSTGRLSLAGVFPLYANLATQDQAARVADRIEKDFLKSGGLVSTLETTIQQWDSPNGWAPLHWVAIKGLRNYGFNELADKIKLAWIDTNMSLYKSQHKLVEKYNVVDKGIMGGGGEYPLQDGFGWTNGVLAALLSEDK